MSTNPIIQSKTRLISHAHLNRDNILFIDAFSTTELLQREEEFGNWQQPQDIRWKD
jgi:hypothetical protein